MRANLVAVTSVLAVLCACTTVDRLNAPPLAGAPATSALALVHVEASLRGMRDSVSLQVVTGATLERIDAKAAAGYVVFSDLPPGPYRLTTLYTTWNNLTYVVEHLYTLPQDSTRVYDVELRAGEPCFIGAISIEDVQTSGQRGLNVQLRDRAKAEALAWPWFARVYASSPWAAASRTPSATCSRR